MTKMAVEVTKGKYGSNGQEMKMLAKQQWQQYYDGEKNNDEGNHKWQ